MDRVYSSGVFVPPRSRGGQSLHAIYPSNAPALLAALIAAALVDGKIDAKERKTLEEVARELGLPPGKLDQEIAAASAR